MLLSTSVFLSVNPVSAKTLQQLTAVYTVNSWHFSKILIFSFLKCSLCYISQTLHFSLPLVLNLYSSLSQRFCSLNFPAWNPPLFFLHLTMTHSQKVPLVPTFPAIHTLLISGAFPKTSQHHTCHSLFITTQTGNSHTMNLWVFQGEKVRAPRKSRSLHSAQ